jgi:opacity protein-like surface antigen
MKRTFLISAACLVSMMTMCQEFRINAYTGYVFDERVNNYYNATSYYDGVIRGGFRWGIGAEYKLQQPFGVELAYIRQDTKAPTEYYDNGVKSRDFDMGISWIMLGGNSYLPKGKLEPFLGGQIGVGIFKLTNPTGGNETSTTKFAWGFRGGANFYLTESLGVKVQADMMSAVQAVGGSLYFSTAGVSPGLTTYSTMLQFTLGGGLVYRIFTGPRPTSNKPSY